MRLVAHSQVPHADLICTVLTVLYSNTAERTADMNPMARGRFVKSMYVSTNKQGKDTDIISSSITSG